MEYKRSPIGDFYIISSDGKIYALEHYYISRGGNKIKIPYQEIKQFKDKYGYLVVSLKCNGKRHTFKSHRIIAKTFIPNPSNKPEVNHINGIKDDNRVENLEWVTPIENVNHSYYKITNSHKGMSTKKKPVQSISLDGEVKNIIL